MSNSVDQRIVEMQFDNAQFERGVADTIASLKGLDSNLSTIGTASGLEKVQAAASSINFDEAIGATAGFGGVLENLKVVASGVFENITTGITKVAKGFGVVDALLHTGVAALSIHGGWNRASAINQAEFKLQGLLKDSKKVELAMKNASDAVNGTAYGLDSAVTATANLVASGVELGDEMKEVLVTIADLAGTSGRDFDSVAHIMGAVAAQGKLSGMQIQQFSLSGLNVTAALAKSMHTTEAEIKNMVSKGQIDFKTFADAMKEQFGGNAVNANKTFEGSLANVRAALSRTTADLFQYGQKAMVPIFNGLRVSINAVNWALKPLLGTWTHVKDINHELQKGVLIKGFEDITKGIGEALNMWGGTIDKAETGNFIIDTLTGEASSSYISQGPLRFRRIFEEVANALKAPLEELGKGSKNFTFAIIEMVAGSREILRLVLEFISPIGMALNDVFGNGSFAQFAKDFRYKFTEPILQSLADFHAAEAYINVVRTAFQILFSVINTGLKVVVPVIGSSLKFIFDLIGSVGLAVGTVFEVIGGMLHLGEEVGLGLSDIMAPIKEVLMNAGLEKVVSFFQNLANGIKAVVSAFKGEDGAFDRLSTFLNEVSGSSAESIKKLAVRLRSFGTFIRNFFANLKSQAYDWVIQNRNVFDPFLEFFRSVGSTIKDVFTTLASSVDFSGFTLPAPFETFVNLVKLLIGTLIGNEEALAALDKLKEALSIQVSSGLESAASSLQNLGGSLSTFAKGFKESALEKTQWALEQLGKIGQRIAPVLDKLKTSISNMWASVKEAFLNANFDFEPVKAFFSGIADSLKTFIEDIANGDFNFHSIMDLFSGLKDSVHDMASGFVPKFLSVLGDVGKGIYDNLQGPLKDLAEWVHNVINPMDTLSEKVSKNVDEVSEKVKTVSQAILPGGDKKNAFKSITGVDTDEFVDEGFNFINAVTNLVQFMTNPIKTLETWASMAFRNVGTFIDSFIESLDWTKIDNFVSHIVSLGVGAGSVAALYQFSQFLEAAKLTMGTFRDIVFDVDKLVKSFSEITKAIEQNIKMQAVKSVAVAVALLVGSLIALSLSDLDKVKQALPILLGLLASVSALVIGFGKLSAMDGFSIAGISAFSNAMLSLGVAVGIMALVTAMLGALPEEQLKRGRSVIIQFSLIFGVLTYMTQKLPKDVGSIGKTFLGLAAAFAAMGFVATVLGAMPEAVMNRGLAIITGFAIGMIVVAAIMGAINANNVRKSAQGLVEMAGAVALLAVSAYVLGGLDSGSLVKGVGAVVVLLAAVSGIIIAFQKFKIYAITKATASILLMSLAVGMLAGAVAGLAVLSMTGADIEGAANSLMTLMVGLSLIAAVLGNSKMNLNTSVFGLAALAVVIGLLAASLVALSLVGNVADVTAAVIQLGFALGIFAGALIAISNLSRPAMSSTAMIIALSITIGILTVALIALAAVARQGGLWEGLTALAVAVGVVVAALAGLAVIGQFLGKGVLTITLSITMLSESFFKFSLGVGILAASVAILVASMALLGDKGPAAADALVESLKRLGRGLWEAKDDMALGIMGVGYALISGLLGLIPMAVMAIAVLVGQLLGALVALAPAIGYGAVVIVEGFITGLSTGINEHGGEVLDAIGQLMWSMVTAIGGVFTEGVNMFSNWLYDVTNGLMGTKPEMEESAREFAESGSQGFRDGNTMVEDNQAKIDETLEAYATADSYGAMSNFAQNGLEGIKESVGDFDIMSLLGLDEDSLDISLSEAASMLGDKGVALPEALQAIIGSGMGDTPLSDILDSSGAIDIDAVQSLYGEAGIAGADQFAESIDVENAKTDITGLMTGSKVIDNERLSSQFSESARVSAEAFANTFTDSISIDGSGPVQQAAKAMELPAQFERSAKVDGDAAVKGLQDSLKTFSDSAKKAATSAVNVISNNKTKRDASTGAKELGRALSDGVALGLNQDLKRVELACDKIIKAIDKVLRKKAEIKSPSRMTARIGRYLVEGLAVGMEDMQGMLARTSEDVMDTGIKAMTTQASYISGLLDDIDGQPVIRPVLDLSAYNAGLASMTGFDTAPLAVSAQYAGTRMFPSTTSSQAAPAAAGNVITISLNYDADADANQMVMDIARGLHTQLSMEGV